MKLALVRQRYTAFGGAERFVEGAIAALQQQDVSITLLARSWVGGQAANAGVNLVHRRIDPFYVGRTWRDWGFSRGVQAEIASGNYDLVQSHERVPGCDIFRAGDGTHAGWLHHRARARGKRFSKPLDPYHRYILAAEAQVFRHPRLRAVICISRLVQREVATYFGLPLERLPLITNSVDLNRFRPASATERIAAREGLGLQPSVPVFAFVGSGFERKGLDACIRHLPREAHLAVAGKDKATPRYQALAERYGVGSRVHFLGPMRDVTPLYRAADAFVFPAIYEPFGNVLLEAMACGLPTLTSETCGAELLIQHGQNGWVTDAFDEDSIAAGFADLMNTLADRERSTAAAIAARKEAEQHTAARMGESMVALYRQLLG